MGEMLMLICGIIGAPEIIVVLIIVLLLFGGRKIPELMRGIGKGVKEYKDAAKGEDEKKKTDDSNKKDNE